MKSGLTSLHNQWILHQAFLVLGGIPLVFLGEAQAIYPGLLLGHIFLLIARSGWQEWRQMGRFLANGTTLIRCLVIFSATFYWESLPGHIIATLFLTGALLDGLDGWLARRMKGQSSLGIVFDEEVDALYILLVTMVIWQMGRTGPWIMVAGWIRSLVLLLKRYLPPVDPPPLRAYPWARTLAGIVFILFPAGILIGSWLGQVLIGLAFCLVLLSFTLELISYYGR